MYKYNEIKQALEQADSHVPSLRFCQLLYNALHAKGVFSSPLPEFFYLRDEEVVAALKDYINQHVK